MGTMKRFLILLGIALEIAAFLGAQADRVPMFGVPVGKAGIGVKPQIPKVIADKMNKK
jgi:hypothetical protein